MMHDTSRGTKLLSPYNGISDVFSHAGCHTFTGIAPRRHTSYTLSSHTYLHTLGSVTVCHDGMMTHGCERYTRRTMLQNCPYPGLKFVPLALLSNLPLLLPSSSLVLPACCIRSSYVIVACTSLPLKTVVRLFLVGFPVHPVVRF